jgi:hypothetical protein
MANARIASNQGVESNFSLTAQVVAAGAKRTSERYYHGGGGGGGIEDGGGGRGGGSGSMKRCTLCGGMFQDVAEHVSSKIHRDALRRSYEANGWEAEFIEEMMAP